MQEGCAVFVLSLFLAACGSRSNLLEPGTDSDAGASTGVTDGFVKCGNQLCDVASGNMCYVCEKSSPPICHTMDLPTSCANPVFLLCDGHDDCPAGESCIAACETSGPCSVPSHVCR